MTLLFFFFFSSRRRHTRSLRDWSSDVCSSDLRFVIARQKPLIRDRRDDEDNRNGDERTDPIKRIKPRQIMKEKFEERHDEQCSASVTTGPQLFPKTQQQQPEREQRPGNRVSHVARKVAGEFKRERVRPRR